MALRLVRRLCVLCREAYRPDKVKTPVDFPWQRLGDRPLYRKVGCRECRHVGYSGRMGIYELLLTDNNIRQLAHDRASTWRIKQAAVKQGMVTLREDGWRKAIDGMTTVDEVLRITKGDQDLAELDKLVHERSERVTT
jgi:general secretion pathway protein E/type IV pilus assembly protein PilB